MVGRQGVTSIELARDTRAELERIVSAGPDDRARRARIILRRADQVPLSTIAVEVGMHRDSVRRWVVRFRERGLAGLRHGNAGKPKKLVFDAEIRSDIQRRAATNPAALGERFASWSLYKLRDHVTRERVVRSISIESLRLMLEEGECSRRYWRHRARPAQVSPEIRTRLLECAEDSDPRQARRARALLEVAQGTSISEVARTWHIGKNSLRRWLTHFQLPAAARLEASVDVRQRLARPAVRQSQLPSPSAGERFP